ncbi:hypothetical protein, partial [Moorena sp. SIO2C4]|uniref:hypothetical protein n=1 Tax=Moorena sp. SIO2C4 TaxID=2607824 RepID=UPI0013C9D8C7
VGEQNYEAMQRGLGEAARSWGFPPLAIAVVSPTRYCIKTSPPELGDLGGFKTTKLSHIHSLIQQRQCFRVIPS